jgi:type 1 glutamine amidotransferase
LNPKANLLLEGTTTGQGNPVKMPVAWTFEPGKSRVFYTSLGYPDDFKVADFNHLLVNAIYLTAGREQPKDK